MLPQLLTYGKFGNLFCGIEHAIIDGKETLNTLLLKKKKGELLIENTFECNTVSELRKQLPEKQHLFLIINNNDVLSKTLEGSYDTSKVIAIAFPNLKLKDFFYEVLVTDQKTFVAICRKEVINNLLEEYTKNKVNVIDFSLGSLIVSQLTSFIDSSTIQTSNSAVSFTNQNVSDIVTLVNPKDTLYLVNGLEIANNSTLPLGGILSYYTNQKFTQSNFLDNTYKLTNDFKQKRIFDIGLKIGLGAIFILLLVSFLFFSSYSSKVDSLNASLEVNKTQKNSFLKLSDLVNKKEKLINDFSLTSSKASWYVDQLGETLPHSIILSEILWQPLLKNIKREKQILVQKSNLIIKGKSSKNAEFSSWINLLEKQSWIVSIEIQEYGTNKKNSTEFELQIEIKK